MGRTKEIIKKVSWEIIKLIIPAFIGFFSAYTIFSKQYDIIESNRLNDNLNKILDINLQYPFVDDSSFIARWNKNKNSISDSSYRYQTYCEYVFNYLQDVCEYYKYEKDKIRKFVDIRDLILLHKGWWSLPEQNESETYPKKFKEFINGCFK